MKMESDTSVSIVNSHDSVDDHQNVYVKVEKNVIFLLGDVIFKIAGI